MDSVPHEDDLRSAVDEPPGRRDDDRPWEQRLRDELVAAARRQAARRACTRT